MSWNLGIDIPMPFETRLNAHEYALGAKMPVVRSSDEAWEALACASEEFRAALERSRREIHSAVQSNVFGDCAEGLALFSRIGEVLTGGAPSINGCINNQVEYLTEHASMCRAANQYLTAADQR